MKDKECPGQPKKFEDINFRILLNQDSTQTLKQWTDALNAAQSIISERLHALRKIQRDGKWNLHEPKKGDIKRRKATREIFLTRQKTKGDEKWMYFGNPSL